jgi:5-methylcytosine-specific restriction endonuclease McrA
VFTCITAKKAKQKGLKRYYTGKPCKHNHVAERLVSNGTCVRCNADNVARWQKANPEKARTNQVKWAERNPGLAQERRKIWYAQNTERAKNTHKLYRQNNRAFMRALSSHARAMFAKRTPAWLTADDQWLINEIYELAELRTQTTRVDWHVDHIVPLRGKTVSGLHVPSNLQVILAAENLRKGNRYAA